MTFELLANPADVKLRTHGATLEEAFAGVVTALSALVGGTAAPTESATAHELDLAARDVEGLLFDFLDELILLQDVEDAVVTRAESVEIEETADGYRLTAVVRVAPISADSPLLDVKAPTYSEMLIEGNGEWTIEAVLDV